MLNESPAGANECDGDEQQRPLQTKTEKISQVQVGLFRLCKLDPTAHSMISRAACKRRVAKFRKFISSEQHFFPGTQIGSYAPHYLSSRSPQRGHPSPGACQPPQALRFGQLPEYRTPLAWQEPGETATGGGAGPARDSPTSRM